jgi:rRNA pseudouridine-1189 N-methylase Emg1 (Nep1/Mra1 family)
MKLGYNQQAKSRSEEILLYIIANYLNILDNKNKNLMKLSFILAVNLESTFYKLFEKQKKLRIFIATATTKITKTNEYIVFKNPQCHNTV